MIVKVEKMDKGWVFYSDVLKIETNFAHCFHSSEERGLHLVMVQRDENEKLIKIPAMHFPIEEHFFDFDEADLKKYASLEDVYIAKVIFIYQNDKIVTLALRRVDQVYLLTDKGETIEKL